MNDYISRRAFLAALGGSAAMVGLAACSTGTAGANGSKNSSGPTASANPSTGPTNQAKPQTINVFDYDSTGIDLWVQADQKFESYFSEKYPNITVKRTKTPFSGYAEALLTAVAGGGFGAVAG